MSNVVQFPLAAMAQRHVGAEFLAEPPPHTHAVQFYEDEAFLFETVARFIDAGLKAGEPILIVTTKAHKRGFVRRLDGPRSEEAQRTGRLMFVDARHVLSKLMLGGLPDPVRFRSLLDRMLAQVSEAAPETARVRVFGEMVDLLWKYGNPRAALALEQLWNEAGARHSFCLLCAYAMGNFQREGDAASFGELCGGHSHVLPTERFSRIDDSEAHLRAISALEQRAEALETECAQKKQLERALRDALKERTRVELELRASLEREQRARLEAEANEAFRRAFADRFGHDLREPLHTILTTARLMTMHRELSQESQRRLERVQASGVRMQRMIEQLLDLIQDRLSAGILVARDREHDLVPIVVRVVDDLRLSNPGRGIELSSAPSCIAAVDADRIEQVVATLLANALAHGDCLRPVRVSIAARGVQVRIAVHNHGPAIEPTQLGRLFEPLSSALASGPRPEGLGLGLYIAQRILQAHSGTLEVESSASEGTRFEAVFPRLC